ncbi:MAG: S9 family peptidase [Acidobacteria bacterium]|nr:MAG: S9 family peptidase [Acidobacteriota bacterium]REK02221.1 MAG: S9 family peptidase [Acidobacteriota bacterium]REK13976.1 MAG: S9 family peptidase [Acidobacteriota bacterium]REK41971.1 MAG: S9 family peptidase [Acidobacteriota bacterium]
MVFKFKHFTGRKKKMIRKVFSLILLSLLIAPAILAQGYKKPPKEILDILNAPLTPIPSISPAKDKIALLEPVRYPPISDLAEPMLRLAGLRINPNTNSDHRQFYFSGLSFKDIKSGRETTVALPEGARIITPRWTTDGKYIAAGNIAENGIELWIIDTETAKATKIKDVLVNTTLGNFRWMPDQRSLIVNLVPKNRGAAPKASGVPKGPNIQETSGRKAAIRTFQDLLASPVDEALFDYYTTSQLAIVSLDGKTTTIGNPAIYRENEVSPDGNYILTSRVVKPYSYLFPYFYFPQEVEIWDRSGKPVHKVASVPLLDNLPVQGVTTAPRSYSWIPTEPATLVWAEALDGGDPRNKVSPRDKLMTIAAPFNGGGKELLKVEQRYSGSIFGESRGMMWFYDYDRDRQHRRIYMVDYRNPGSPKLVSDLNIRDRYNDIGSPVTKDLPNGQSVVLMKDGYVFLSGRGSTPEGDRPFLNKMELEGMKTTELFRSEDDEFETFVDFSDDKALSFFTRRETSTDPPNLIFNFRCAPGETCIAMDSKPITDFKDPTPQLRGIKKQLVKYKRADGVDLSFTLYLPPGHKEGERLPAIVWAYPLEYTDADTAGQVTGSTNRFTSIGGYSHLFFVLRGYAVLDDATMPIVGDPLTVNDTFIEQLVSSAKAAIDEGDKMGVIDPNRVGVGGHSYGAFMTAHLLAQSDLFNAGIARSGAYNRTLTPFGFQSERRSFWEAPEIYFKLSPFMAANKINEPMLMIHGEADNNSGTYPMQSERMFAAIQGNGGTARLVMLPLESHGYAARESIEHTLYEMFTWMDKYVKDAKEPVAEK